MTTLAAVSLLIWLYLVAAHGRFWQAGPELAPTRPSIAPPVHVVVPARDEAPMIAASLRSLLRQDYAGPLRVILVDDGSTDSTGTIARGLIPRIGGDEVVGPATTPDVASPITMPSTVMAGLGPATHDRGVEPPTDVGDRAKPGHDSSVVGIAAATSAVFPHRSLTILDGRPRPAGWSGKLWAVAQGVAETDDAELIMLTDADIVHDTRHIATLVAQAERGDFDLVSEMVALSCNSPAERALVPAFVLFFQLLYPFAWVNDPLRATAAAAGGTILLRRRALERIGGIAAVRGALIDDVALAAAVKRGGRIWLGHSALARSLRSYPTAADIWRMVTRTAYVQLRFSPLLLAMTIAAMTVTFLAPPFAALFAHGVARWFGWLAWGLMAASYQPTLHRFHRSVLWAPALPVVATFYLAATIGSAVNHHLGRGVAWKGRAYQGAGA